MKTIPSLPTNKPGDNNSAADLIRQKLNQVYAEEPSAKAELQDVNTPRHHSKHQHFMVQLSQSGRSLAEIQTAWHNYYLALPDVEKHHVWNEFYKDHASRSRQGTPVATPKIVSHPPVKSHNSKSSKPKTVTDIKKHLLSQVRGKSGQNKSSHIKSLLFGLSTGLLVVVILLFGFFNERFLAPFITPSKTVSSTPIILDPNSSSAGPEAKIIIPKINVEIPVIYDQPSVAENDVQKALEHGVLHYATTSNPGELGHGAIFGHSSNNILNKGDYKFAFVLLSRLESGDTFVLQKDSKRYVYRVFDKKVVSPNEVSILTTDYSKPATFSLITCDPPGTSLRRLVVTGEQITPDPNSNVASTATTANAPAILPSNSPTLWSRLTEWLTN